MFATEELRLAYQRIAQNHYYKSNSQFREQKLKYKRDRTKELRKMALEVYNCECQECGFYEIKYLQFHHTNGTLRSAAIIGKRESHYATLARIMRNGIQEDLELLCPTCHKKADVRDGTQKPGYWRPKGPLDNFL